MRILGVDLGTVRVGLAVSDDLGLIASPLRTTTVADADQAVETVLAAVRETGAQKVVLGHARRLNGRRGQKARECEAFAEALTGRGLAVVLWDERLSTVEAERHLQAAGLSARQRRERRDAVAAQRILQSFLAAQSAGGAVSDLG